MSQDWVEDRAESGFAAQASAAPFAAWVKANPPMLLHWQANVTLAFDRQSRWDKEYCRLTPALSLAACYGSPELVLRIDY